MPDPYGYNHRLTHYASLERMSRPEREVASLPTEVGGKVALSGQRLLVSFLICHICNSGRAALSDNVPIAGRVNRVRYTGSLASSAKCLQARISTTMRPSPETDSSSSPFDFSSRPCFTINSPPALFISSFAKEVTWSSYVVLGDGVLCDVKIRPFKSRPVT